MSKHTPGPWAVFGKAGYAGHKVGDCTARSVAAFPSTSRRSEDERNANARLIAAAPDLLVALKYAEPFLRRFGSSDEATAVEMAIAAIAKAEGVS